MTAEEANLAARQTTRSYYPALDGLRGVAILLVIVYHNFGFINQFYFGWIGVDLFFVLSGFLITDILINTVGQPNFFLNFYMRRVLRIVPLYYLSLVFFIIIYPLFFTSPNFSYYQQNQFSLWIYLQNWLYIFNPNNDVTILHHFWSLAVEEQFYLLWPITILWIRKPKWLIAILGIALISVIVLRYIVWEFKIENFAYFNFYTFSRIDGICIGSMLALIVRINKNFIGTYQTIIVIGLALFNFLFFFLNRSKSYSLPYLAIAGYTTFAVILAILVYEAILQKNRWINFIFTNRILIFFGKLSYGLYVYHWPIYLILQKPIGIFFRKSFPFLPHAISVSIALSVIAVIISWASYHSYEKYFINMKKKFSQ